MKKNKLKFILCLLPLIIYICSCFALQNNPTAFNSTLFTGIFSTYFNIGNGDILSLLFNNICNSAFNTNFNLICLYISYLVYLQFIYICYDLIVFLPKTIEKMISRGECL